MKNSILEERYCSSKVARLLQQNGFDFDNPYTIAKPCKDECGEYWTCTHQSAMDWLRTKKRIFISIHAYRGNHYDGYIDCFEINVYSHASTIIVPEEIRLQYDYGKAVESALIFALETVVNDV
ncbi:MAG: hypothetical protein J6Y37_01120 [Paludibacteraceae bacterium]|nr:hypothetical protein [Paludibacteraceae bacterium]